MNLADAHCHLGNSELSYLNINYPMCICACFQKDWEQLKNLKNKFVKKAFGIFPNSQTDFPTQTISIEEQLEILQTYLKYADALGEAGFDSRFIKKIPIQEQRKLFTEQIKLAKKFELPLIIHCVRKYGELLDTLKKESKNLGKFLIHATKCSPEICKYLGITLLPQAGVALGMCTTAAVQLGQDGNLIRNITLFAVLMYELFGPVMTRMALTAAGDIKPMADEVKQRRQTKLEEAKNR